MKKKIFVILISIIILITIPLVIFRLKAHNINTTETEITNKKYLEMSGTSGNDSILGPWTKTTNADDEEVITFANYTSIGFHYAYSETYKQVFYLVNGVVNGLKSYLTAGGTGLCTSGLKAIVTEHGSEYQINEYNNICYNDIPIYTITINWNGGTGVWNLSGYSQIGDYWKKDSDGIYSIKELANREVDVVFGESQKLTKSSKGELVGWSKSSSCSNLDVEGTGGEFAFSVVTSNITYYACYAGDIKGASRVTIDYNGGSGPLYFTNNSDGHIKKIDNTTFYVDGVAGTTEQFVFDRILKAYPGGSVPLSHIGWSKYQNCSTIHVSSTGTIHQFPVGDSDVTYYACFNGDQFANSLFGSGGLKKTGKEIKKVENTFCDQTPVNNGWGEIVSSKITNTYEKISYETIPVDNNDYCNVKCTDEINISYPNIFETVPAGSYFELMYEPSMTATRTCKAEFNYKQWKKDYEKALENELKALNEFERAEASWEAAKALNPTASGRCGCCCSGEGCTCSGSCKTRYSDYETKNYFNTDGTELSQSQSFSKCGSSSTASKVNSAKNNMKSKKEDYKEAVDARTKLERDNLQCYTIIDSNESNDADLSYDEVFQTNYETINKINPIYKTDTSRIIVPTDSYGTNTDYYINYINNKTTITSDNLKQLGTNSTGTSTKEFFAVFPKLQFSYDTGSSGKAENDINHSNYYKDTLLVESLVKKDTGAYTNYDTSTKIYTKKTDTINFNKYFAVNDSGSTSYRNGTHINFNAYFSNYTTIERTVSYHYIFHEATEFYSYFQSGEITTTKNPGDNISLSKKSIYNYNGTILDDIKNHVYPVSLKAVTDNYNLNFRLTDSGIDNNGYDGNNYLEKSFDLNGNVTYTCNYEITNDALTLDNKLSGNTYKNLQNNTFFRSVSTVNLDPNNREQNGDFGENWTNLKGQAVRTIIESKEKSGERNTYNPKYLEYSFTLTPLLIKAIKDYNSDNSYDDFNLTCATSDGRECTSKFLTDLVNGKVGHFTYDNYSTLNSFDSYDLQNIRDKWKYYNGNIEEFEQGNMTLDKYLSLYEKWGVLP